MLNSFPLAVYVCVRVHMCFHHLVTLNAVRVTQNKLMVVFFSFFLKDCFKWAVLLLLQQASQVLHSFFSFTGISMLTSWSWLSFVVPGWRRSSASITYYNCVFTFVFACQVLTREQHWNNHWALKLLGWPHRSYVVHLPLQSMVKEHCLNCT